VKLLQHISPHQFGVVTKGGYETVMHNIRYNLDLHLDSVILELDVVHTFNSMSKGVIFQKFRAMGGDIIQLIPFVCAFYAFEFPLFYSHCNCEGDVIIIPFAMGTRQGDLLEKTLFTLAHFRALHFIVSHFPSCLFPSIANNIHIIGPPSIVSFIYKHVHIELRAIGVSIQLKKCIAWSPFSLPLNFNTPS
jgi:hypothetical protein